MAWVLRRLESFMDEQKSVPAEPRSREPETSTASRGVSPGAGGARSGGLARLGQTPPATTEPQRLEIVVRIAPAAPQQTEPPKPVAEQALAPVSLPPTANE